MDRDWSIDDWNKWWESAGGRPDGEVIESSHHHDTTDDQTEEEDIYAPTVSEMLKKHKSLISGDAGSGSRVFLTFCGKSLDLKWLADEGFDVVGNDCSDFALKSFLEEQGLEYDTSKSGGFTIYKAKNTKLALYAGNFFELTGEKTEGKFDAVWDTGSFQSVGVTDRATYARAVSGLMKQGCKYLLSVTQFKELRTWTGPPYEITEEILDEIFGENMKWEFVDQAPWGDYMEKIYLLQLR
uniref:thiopurine S-methyltransferase n=1 Tax=Ciona intestinalis TaxID=7719 RepID=UPI000180C3DA|nr:thiopurine S-methyltransferase [Ciona intestinalis]|eukprot:XP_002128754.1 thiopurine S-methyltransferase [Ciona intestinalis]